VLDVARAQAAAADTYWQLNLFEGPALATLARYHELPQVAKSAVKNPISRRIWAGRVG
jgi:hypothetical protein